MQLLTNVDVLMGGASSSNTEGKVSSVSRRKGQWDGMEAMLGWVRSLLGDCHPRQSV